MFDLFDQQQAKIVIPVEPWMKSVKMTLVTAENIVGIFDRLVTVPVCSLDLETTGLDNRLNAHGVTNDTIVGFPIAVSPDEGYYIPVRHGSPYEHHNVAASLVASQLKRLFQSPCVVVFHNAKFDQEFLEYDSVFGFILREVTDFMNLKRWDDTMFMAYCVDSREIQGYGLKFLSQQYCGRKMIELSQLFPAGTTELNFSLLDPSDPYVLTYACSDAVCTMALYLYLLPKVTAETPNLTFVYTIEKGCILSVRAMERNGVKLDRERIRKLMTLGQKEAFEALTDVYESANIVLGRDIRPLSFRLLGQKYDPEGSFSEQLEAARTTADHLLGKKMAELSRQMELAKLNLTVDDLVRENATHLGNQGKEYPGKYDVMSANQFGVLLEEMGVEGLQYTEKSKQVNTSKAVIEELLERYADEYPFLSKVRVFRNVQKALSSYLEPLYRNSEPQECMPGGRVKFKFKQNGTDTGRFSTPKGSPKDHSAEINLQALPGAGKKGIPECLAKVRETLIAEDGYFIVAADFSGVELRIATNISLEPLWLSEFFRCDGCGKKFDQGDGINTPLPPPKFCPVCGSDKIGDLHTLTGISIYGAEAKGKPDWKQKRGAAKSTNFALLYGGGGSAVVRAAGVPKQEGWDIKHKFDSTYKGLKIWWDQQHRFAREHMYVVTPFGRKYPVPDISHEDGAFRSKAERNSVNSPVQATSADITKIAMWLIHKEIQQRGWQTKVRMLITMHDELVFEIHKSVLAQACDVINELMTRNKPLMNRRWRIPLTTDIEIGHSWSVPWNLFEIFHTGEWPQELKPWFPQELVNRPGFGKTPAPVATPPVVAPVSTGEEPGEESPEDLPESTLTVPVVEAKPVVSTRPKYVYRLKCLLTEESAFRLFGVIVESQVREGDELEVQSQQGEVLKLPHVIQVNKVTFQTKAKAVGL